MVAEVVYHAVTMGMGRQQRTTASPKQRLLLYKEWTDAGHHGELRLLLITTPFSLISCINVIFKHTICLVNSIS